MTTKYDDAKKVLAIPNYLGVLGDSRRQNASSLPPIWELEENEPLPSVCFSPPNPAVETSPDSLPPSNPSSFKPPIISTPMTPDETLPDFFSPDIANGDLDDASTEEFTGMIAEFTSRKWFNGSESDGYKGQRNRRVFSWYDGYHGGNMKWRQLMTLITKVHFKFEKDMVLNLVLPSEAQKAQVQVALVQSDQA